MKREYVNMKIAMLQQWKTLLYFSSFQTTLNVFLLLLLFMKITVIEGNMWWIDKLVGNLEQERYGKKIGITCCITRDEFHLWYQTPIQLLWHASFSVVLKVLLIIMYVGCVCGGRTQCLKSLYWGIIDIRRGRVQFYKFTFGRRVIDNWTAHKTSL